MSDVAAQPAYTELARRDAAFDRNVGFGVYGLFLLSFIVPVLPTVAGAVIAHARRDDAEPLGHSHFNYQVRTFWISLGLGVLCLALAFLTGVSALTGVFDFVTDGSRWDAWDIVAVDAETFEVSGLTIALGAASGFTGVLSVLWLLGASLFGLARLASDRPVGQAGL